MTAAQTAAIENLKLANNGVTFAECLNKKHHTAVAELVAMGVVVKTTHMMFGFGLKLAYKLA